MSHRIIAWPLSFVVGCGLGAAGCGGAPPAAEAPTVDAPTGPTARDVPAGERMSAMGETGALNKADVQAAFQRAMPAVQRCLAAGRQRLPFLFGDIEVFLRIDGTGRATTAQLTQSTVGDEQVEACMLAAFRDQQWPRPVGGKVGETSQSFSFSRDPDEEAPIAWTPQKLAAAMAEEAAALEGEAEEASSSPPPFAELTAKLDQCRRDAGASRLSLTLHVDEDGMFRSVGLASPDEQARDAVACIKTVLSTTSFPSPRSNFAKMTLSIP